MYRHHPDQEVQRFDLMKLGVFLLLLALLFLTWYAFRGTGNAPLAAQPTTDPAALATATARASDSATAAAELAALPVPTLGAPSVNAPAGSLPEGVVTLSGMAGPGAQVAILIDGVPAGLAVAGVDGAWTFTTDLLAGDYAVVAQTVDNVGAVVGESAPLALTVTGARPPLNPLAFDPLTGTYELSGAVGPSETVTVVANGAPVGTATADASGNWTLTAPAGAITGEVVVQAADAAGNVTLTTQPIAAGDRPPSITPSGEVVVDPATGAAGLSVPAGAVTWTGQGAPNTQVEAVLDGQRAGTAAVDAAGVWTLTAELPPGAHELQLNTLDASGNVVSSARPMAITAGEALAEATPVATPIPAPTVAPAPTDATIVGLLASRAELSTLQAAVQTAGLADPLNGPGPFTLFAPTNDAFAALPQSFLDRLGADPQLMATLLRYHVAAGRYLVEDLRTFAPATVDGRLLTIVPEGDSLTVNGAAVVAGNVTTNNGVVHVVDRVLLPPLPAGMRAPAIDGSGVAEFVGTHLTIVGTAEPGHTILVELNGEAFGQPATADAAGAWQVAGDVTPGEYRIVAFMMDGAGMLEALSTPLALTVRQ